MIIHSPIISGSLTFASGSTFTLPANGQYTGSFSGSVAGIGDTLQFSSSVDSRISSSLFSCFASTITINGSAATINWPNAALPTPTANRKEIESLTLLNVGGTWTVFGQYLSLGIP